MSEQTNQFFSIENFYLSRSLIHSKQKVTFIKDYFIPGIFNSHKNPPKKTHFPHLINEEDEAQGKTVD